MNDMQQQVCNSTNVPVDKGHGPFTRPVNYKMENLKHQDYQDPPVGVSFYIAPYSC